KLGKESRPWLIRRPDRAIFAFAALWETWHSPDGSEIDTVALLNTSANGVISAIHERSPVILPKEDFAAWLDPGVPAKEAVGLLRPPAEDLLEMVRIGRAVNSIRNDGPELQQPASEPEPPPPSPPPEARRQGDLF
ncbi:MAG: SOS response-associated peptidase, partial [Beijerinckiaceae bacterium]